MASVVVLVPALTGAAFAGPTPRYTGRTSQRQPISFSISGGHLRGLQFRLEDTCQNGHVYLVHDFDFAPIQISHSRFKETFISKEKTATVTVKGQVMRRSVAGSITDQRSITHERRRCRGRATFNLPRPSRSQGEGKPAGGWTSAP
jgi:hypothetical protein